ncbi:MAG: hypothetical protein ACXVB9_01810 [Bdellovibrionota bacterium]
MKILFLLFGLIPALAGSWHYNENGGFGIYQPEGWSVQDEGRSTRLTGPERDSAQSDFFLGSDWVSKVKIPEDLRGYVQEETGSRSVESITVSGLPGFRAGTAEHGSYYLLRIPENVIVVQYDLRGSRDQIDEGLTMISSVEVRTRPNPQP